VALDALRACSIDNEAKSNHVLLLVRANSARAAMLTVVANTVGCPCVRIIRES
jgi:hypothetical protein